MKVIYTAEAEKRLKDIFSYYNLNAGRRVALKIVNEIITETETLQNNPNLGVREPLLQNRKLHYFFIVIKNYKVIYRISEDLIIVSTIFDTRQNPKKIGRRLK